MPIVAWTRDIAGKNMLRQAPTSPNGERRLSTIEWLSLFGLLISASSLAVNLYRLRNGK